jgi:hypothetical protein
MRKLALALAVPALIAAVPASAEVLGGLRIGANRSNYRGACPVEVVFTANVIITNNHGPAGVFNYHWERSDGAKSGQNVVRVGPSGETLIYKEHWRLGRSGSVHDISVTFFANSGNQHMQETSQTVHIECQ